MTRTQGDIDAVFIVRFWREPRQIPDARPEWRGVIEHVPTGEKRYFLAFDDMKAFIQRFGVWDERSAS